MARIAPAFSIKMQTKHEIGMQLRVYQHGTTADFAVAVKQDFALPANRLLFLRIVWIKNIRPRLRHSIFDQNFLRELPEIIRTFRSDWFGAIANKRNPCAQFS